MKKKLFIKTVRNVYKECKTMFTLAKTVCENKKKVYEIRLFICEEKELPKTKKIKTFLRNKKQTLLKEELFGRMKITLIKKYKKFYSTLIKVNKISGRIKICLKQFKSEHA